VEEIAISEFEAKCSALLEQVRKTKRPIRITGFGKRVAEVFPPATTAQGADWLGSMAGRIKILGDIVSPIIEEAIAS
jgi:prevent-host-death family protein